MLKDIWYHVQVTKPNRNSLLSSVILWILFPLNYSFYAYIIYCVIIICSNDTSQSQGRWLHSHIFNNTQWYLVHYDPKVLLDTSLDSVYGFAALFSTD